MTLIHTTFRQSDSWSEREHRPLFQMGLPMGFNAIAKRAEIHEELKKGTIEHAALSRIADEMAKDVGNRSKAAERFAAMLDGQLRKLGSTVRVPNDLKTRSLLLPLAVQAGFVAPASVDAARDATEVAELRQKIVDAMKEPAFYATNGALLDPQIKQFVEKPGAQAADLVLLLQSLLPADLKFTTALERPMELAKMLRDADLISQKALEDIQKKLTPKPTPPSNPGAPVKRAKVDVKEKAPDINQLALQFGEHARVLVAITETMFRVQGAARRVRYAAQMMGLRNQYLALTQQGERVIAAMRQIEPKLIERGLLRESIIEIAYIRGLRAVYQMARKASNDFRLVLPEEVVRGDFRGGLRGRHVAEERGSAATVRMREERQTPADRQREIDAQQRLEEAERARNEAYRQAEIDTAQRLQKASERFAGNPRQQDALDASTGVTPMSENETRAFEHAQRVANAGGAVYIRGFPVAPIPRFSPSQPGIASRRVRPPSTPDRPADAEINTLVQSYQELRDLTSAKRKQLSDTLAEAIPLMLTMVQSQRMSILEKAISACQEVLAAIEQEKMHAIFTQRAGLNPITQQKLDERTQELEAWKTDLETAIQYFRQSLDEI